MRNIHIFSILSSSADVYNKGASYDDQLSEVNKKGTDENRGKKYDFDSVIFCNLCYFCSTFMMWNGDHILF